MVSRNTAVILSIGLFSVHLAVSLSSSSMPSEYVRCRKFMEGVEKMVDGDGSVTSELKAGNPDFMKTKSYCEAILKHKRHNYLEDYGDSRCKIGLFSQDNFEGHEENFEEDHADLRVNVKSIKTYGKCCWTLFRRRNFSRKSSTVQGDTELAKQELWGGRVWGARPVMRSLKKLPHC